MRFINRKTLAIAGAAAALVAVGSTGTAVAGSLIGSADIENGSIRSIDIKDGRVRTNDLSAGTIAKLQGQNGKDGKNGFTGLEYRTYDYIKGIGHRPGHDGAPVGYVGAGYGGIATVACSDPSKTAIAGGVQFLGLDNGNGDMAVQTGTGIVDSFPGRMDWTTSPATPKENRLDGWIVRMNQDAVGEPLSVWAICVSK